MKSYEEIMEILEAFALTNSYRAAGELAGCSHHTVEHWVTMRDKGLLPDGQSPVERPKLVDGFMPKIEEWVERSNGKVRGDVVFDKLVGLGFEGSDRTVRRALAVVKLNWRAGRRRVYRPWVVEPGMWAQWDWGHGPKIGRSTHEECPMGALLSTEQSGSSGVSRTSAGRLNQRPRTPRVTTLRYRGPPRG